MDIISKDSSNVRKVHYAIDIKRLSVLMLVLLMCGLLHEAMEISKRGERRKRTGTAV